MYRGLGVVVLFLLGCASTPRPQDDKELLAYGIDRIAEESYTEAIAAIKEWQQKYPLDPANRDAYLNLIYINYLTGDYALVSSYGERFLQLYGDDYQADFVMYLEAMSQYEENRPRYEDYVYTEVAQRDMGAMLLSFDKFRRLVLKYPQSIYAFDSYKRMIYINERLAAREYAAVKFFMRRGQTISALMRARYIMENYSETKYFEYAVEVARLASSMIGDLELEKYYTELKNKYKITLTLGNRGDFDE